MMNTAKAPIQKTFRCFRCKKTGLSCTKAVKASKRLGCPCYAIEDHKPCGRIVFSIPPRD